jgi:hypothetical protein
LSLTGSASISVETGYRPCDDRHSAVGFDLSHHAIEGVRDEKVPRLIDCYALRVVE